MADADGVGGDMTQVEASCDPVLAAVGLGSNLGRPMAQLHAALQALDQSPGIQRIQHSRFYRSQPLGPQDQPMYVNAVVLLFVTLSPDALLARLQAIEVQGKRDRSVERWGPRTIDLDLLLYGQECIALPHLRVPHPEMTRRAFVMVPLAELVPEWRLPCGRRVAYYASVLSKLALDMKVINA